VSRDAESLIDYLGRILQAIERIETYTEDMNEVTFQQTLREQNTITTLHSMQDMSSPSLRS